MLAIAYIDFTSGVLARSTNLTCGNFFIAMAVCDDYGP